MNSVVIRSIGETLNLISLFAPRYASKKALKLFSTPRKGKLTDAEIPVLQTAYYEELKYNNLPIATYRWIGSNKTILLAHGWESNASRWQNLIRSLKKDQHHVIALDGPAHGQSGGQEFNAILFSEFINMVVQKYQPEIIIGHSVGAMATIFGQHKYRNSCVKKIVSLGCPAHFEGVFGRYVKMMSYNKKIEQGISNLIIERFEKNPDYFSVAKFSADLDAQGLIIHDQFDDVIPYEEAVLLHASYKNSQLFTTKNLGHSLKDPSVNETIISFINS